MFIAKRKKKVFETFALADEDGNIVHTYDVSCDPEEHLIEYNRAINKIIKAEQLIKEEPNPQNYEIYGAAVIDMMGIFFGEEASKEILAFFEDRYTEMITEVFPFITDVLMPKMREISEKELEKVRKRRK